MLTRRRLSCLALGLLLALLTPSAAHALPANGHVGWTDSNGEVVRWLSRGLTDFGPTIRSRLAGPLGAWSPDGTRWASVRIGTLQILDNGGLVRGNWPNHYEDSVSDWSKDGRFLLLRRRHVRSYTEVDYTLVLFDVNTGAERVIPTPLLQPGPHPSLSPDGRRVIFSSEPFIPLRSKLFTVGVDGSDLRLLPIGGPDWAMTHPRFSPDGRRVVFVRVFVSEESVRDPRDARELIFTADLDGRNLEAITRDHSDSHPEWSPDGNYIAFVRNVTTGCESYGCSFVRDVFVVRSNGAVPFDLSARPGWNMQPSWQAVPRPASAPAAPARTASISLQPAEIPLPLDRGTRVPVDVLCPLGSPGCAGTVQLRSGDTTVASGRYSIRAGNARELRLRVKQLTPQLGQDDRAATLAIVAKSRRGPRPRGGRVTLQAASGLDITCPTELLPGQPAIITGDASPAGSPRFQAAARTKIGLLLESPQGEVLTANASATSDGRFSFSTPLEGGTWTAVASTAGDRAHLPAHTQCIFNVRSEPVVHVDEPTAGAALSAGQPLALRGGAVDADGAPIVGSGLVWKVDGNEVGRGESASVSLTTGGPHVIRLEATDGRGLTGAGELTVNVRALPSVRIEEPAAGATPFNDAPIQLRGSAVDADGAAIGGDALVWKVDGVEVARGQSAAATITFGGSHTIRLEASDRGGLTGASEVTIEIRRAGPTVSITLPNDGDHFPTGSTKPVTFTAKASDVQDGQLGGASLRWFDDYTDKAGPQHVEFGSGDEVSRLLYTDGGGHTPHTITVVATNSAGQTSSATVRVTSGEPGDQPGP